MRIRPLRDPEDARAVLRVHGRAWEAAYGELLPASVNERVASASEHHDRVEAAYEDLASYGEGRVHVAEDDDATVLGYTLFRWGEDETKGSVRDGEAELKELYVDPGYWNEGVGTALLEAGLDALPAALDAVALEMLAGNEVGRSFYEARGFEPVASSSVDIADQTYETRVYRKRLE